MKLGFLELVLLSLSNHLKYLKNLNWILTIEYNNYNKKAIKN